MQTAVRLETQGAFIFQFCFRFVLFFFFFLLLTFPGLCALQMQFTHTEPPQRRVVPLGLESVGETFTRVLILYTATTAQPDRNDGTRAGLILEYFFFAKRRYIIRILELDGAVKRLNLFRFFLKINFH